jgi:hypothetical protein
MISTRTLVFLSLFLTVFTAGAQIRIIPVYPSTEETKTQAEFRSIQETLTLPFWDDFNDPGRPDTTIWQNSENVFVNAGLSNDPPSLYVASFDGLDEFGNPYGNGSSEGLTDSLTSRPIDLSGYSPGNSIYLSFFYQAAGFGDIPEEGDSIIVEFKTDAGQWVSVWPESSSSLQRDGNFYQVLLPLTATEWLHESFQFRFQAAGRQSGAFDTWNIDYVYMNENRSPFDTSYPDRTISEPLTGFLGEYTQIPYAHFRQEQLTMPSFRIRSMVQSVSNQNRAYNYFFNYDIDVTDTLENTTSFAETFFVEPLESPLMSNTSEEVVIREPFPDFAGIEGADSARVTLEIILDADDNVPISEDGDYDPAKYSPIDFQENDTLRKTYYLTDSYGYDDGTAEMSAGLNTAGDRLAYQYTMVGVEDALLTGMDMYFPFTGSNPSGKQIELTVWQDEGGQPGSVIFRQLVNARLSEAKNELVRYEFARPVLVAGTFYIGYRQNSPGSLGIGLDRNTSTGDKFFFNLGELWEQNTLVEGSLMLHPVFGKIDGVVVGIDDEIASKNPPYPNPSADGTFFIKGSTSQIQITDLTGRRIAFDIVPMGTDFMKISILQPASGMYLVHDGENTYKILIP